MTSPLSSRLLQLLLPMATLAFAAAAQGGVLVPADEHPKYEINLPAPGVLDATQGGSFVIDMRETRQWLGLVDDKDKQLTTRVWGYGPGMNVTYPGPTFEARTDVPVDVLWQNKLPGMHLLPVDTSLHWANPATTDIATVTHLHGGHTESASDGLPEAWFTRDFKETGPTFVKQLYHYDNDQEAATLWYHDHALGITRLNVYAGLAGFYLLRDENELGLISGNVLPSGDYERAVVIQDRSFDSKGELDLPVVPPELECPLPNPRFGEPGEPETIPCDETPFPSAIAEFFGDYILVNGVTWPKLEVEPRKYRLRLLNGSDSRFYILEFRDAYGMRLAAERVLQIGTDDGLLEEPVALEQLLSGPGERHDLVVDFAGLQEGAEVFLRNLGPDDPFKGCTEPPPNCAPSDGEGGALPPADPDSTGQIMKFVVVADSGAPNATVGFRTPLNSIAKPEQAARTRQVVLFEGLDNFGRLQPLLGTLEDRSLGWFEEITENPGIDDTEIWEIYNVTEDAHPIHLHLVTFQILDRRKLDESRIAVEDVVQPQHDGAEGVGGKLVLLHPNPFVGGPIKPADNEMGLKDTIQALPGQVTRVIAKFDRPGRYVWHCHILSHEDHEMMRPYCVGDLTEENCGPIGEPIEP